MDKRITENFKDHIATISDHGDLKILDWKKPGTGNYYVRYVFDDYKIYISGDLGTAVFNLTWKANIHSFNDIHFDYFHEKMSAYHSDKYTFNSEEAVRRLGEWFGELRHEGVLFEYKRFKIKDLFEQARECSEEYEWRDIVQENLEFISELDSNYWEWFYEIGRDYPLRFKAYLIGLQMASKQLLEADTNEV